jgi:hypothetical protein
MNRDEARAWYVGHLLEKIREDPYPSSTQMSLVEEALAEMPQLVPDYMQVLLEKVANDRFPSTYMLKRIATVAEQLPAAQQLPSGE